jgi:hypothetical protein
VDTYPAERSCTEPMADTRDPRFPNRPDHPDFWLMSEVLVAQDTQADQGVQSFDDMVNRYVDLKSLRYVAEQQAGMFIQQRGARKLVYGSREVEVMIEAAFLAAFVHGVRFQIRKQQGDVDQNAIDAQELRTLLNDLDNLSEDASNLDKLELQNEVIELALKRWPDVRISE